ncbi:MAG: hypothetical protein V1899_12010 [Planctomycetota bacterium]
MIVVALAYLLLAGFVTQAGENVVNQSAVVKPFKALEGVASAGWDLLLKNQFAEAEAAFREILKNDAKNLIALEGLRNSLISRGYYQAAQKINLQMLAACSDASLANVFATRATDAINYVESRADILNTFNQAADTAVAAGDATLAALLKDYLVSLYLQYDQPAEASAALAGLGYVKRWQFVTGPFGAKDKNNPIDKRFAPERALKTLAFTDETGKPVPLRQDVSAPLRSLDMGSLLHGAEGIYYAFTNLDSNVDQEVLIYVSAHSSYRLYLRGMPIIQAPGEEQFRRSGGELARVKLSKGSNPLLLKVSSTGLLVVRVLGSDYGPLKGVQVKLLSDAELASHEVSTMRGVLLSERTSGLLAQFFLKRLTPEERAAGQGLKTLIERGELTVPEAAWLDFAAQCENDVRARELLACALAATAPDSVSALDLAAHILRSAGATMGNTEAREAEEARRLREHALMIAPNSHQHLLALCHFFSERGLFDQALEKIKACAAAHPHSAIALFELGQLYQRKQFLVEAEQCYEKAAALDNVYLARLAYFHESVGNCVRARDLRQKAITLGLLDANAQFEVALEHGDLITAEQCLQRQEKAYPDRTNEWTAKRVQLLVEKGDLKDAYKMQEKIYAACRKTDPNKRQELLKTVDLGLRLSAGETPAPRTRSQKDRVKELLRAYLQETPGDYECRRRLRGLDDAETIRWWEPYDVKVSEIDTSAFTAKNYPTADHAWIVDFMVTRILPDLSRESYVHIAQKVLNQNGINKLSEVLVSAQRNEIVFIRTLNPDGSSYEPQNVHNFNFAQSASLYQVGPGSILEHSYLEHHDADADEPTLIAGFNFNAIDAPRAISRWVVLIADEAKSKLNIRKIVPELIDEKILPGPPGYTTYQWTNKQIEGIKREPRMPTDADQEVIPLALIETPERPYQVSRWLMQREREFIPPEAEEEARKITNGKSDDAAKFEAIVRWVRDRIQPSNDSRTLDDVWFSRSGNTDQMTLLTREMAQHAGLKVTSAYINAAYQPGRVWHSKNAKRQWSPEQLVNFGSGGHMLVLEQSDGADRWAQFVGKSPKFYNPFDQNGSLAGTLALTPGEEGARIKRLKGAEMDLTPITHHAQINFDAVGGGTIKGTLQLYGALAGNVRENWSDPRQKSKIKEWVVNRAWPKIETPEIAIKGEAVPDSPISFTYSGAARNLASQEKGAFFREPFAAPSRLLALRGPPERQHDLLIKNEIADLDHTLTYICPEGCAWVEAPDDLCLVTEFGFYIVDYTVKGRALSYTRSYLMPAQRVTPDKYPLLQDFIKQLAIDAQQRIAYTPLKAKSFGTLRQEIYSGGYSSCGEECKPQMNTGYPAYTHAPESRRDE